MDTIVGGRFGVLLPYADLDDLAGESTYDGLADVDLCSICQNLFHGAWGSHRVVDVFRSVRKGCGFCKVLKSALEVDYNEDLLRAAQTTGTLEYEAQSVITNLGDRLLVTWEIHYPSPRRVKHLICEILMIPEAEIPKLPRLPLRNSVREPKSDKQRTATSSSKTLGLAKTWLKYCCAEHSLCRLLLTETRRLPTRLLEIQSGVIRLRNGKNLPVETPYLALSHCWGQGIRIKLCQHSPFLQGKELDTSELPATFQHAIRATESLGHSYLWIDSLCIIQDSEEDRREECSRMWEVYGNSVCTLAATASSNGDGGLFREHSVGGPNPCKITPRSGYFRDGGVYTGVGFHFLHDYELIKRIDESPLCCRGWVAQERLLSPRILHFDSTQLWWECRELCASETYPQGLPENLDGSVKQQWDPVSIAQTGKIDQCYKAWTWCVEYFTACQLSDPQDKLIAVAGVARQISQGVERLGQPDTYLAGLWKSQIPFALLWARSRRQRSHVNANPLANYRAPSWSWASVDGDVKLAGFGRNVTSQETELLSHGLSTSGGPFGATTDGHIRLRGPLARVRLSTEETTSEHGRLHDQEGQIEQLMSTTVYVPSSPSSVFAIGILPDYEEDHQVGQATEIYLLKVCSAEGSSMSSRGLILRPATNGNGTFCRLGTFSMEIKASEQFWSFTALCEDPDMVYEEAHGEGRYTIRVI